jgi:hypothetical protein
MTFLESTGWRAAAAMAGASVVVLGVMLLALTVG